MIYQNYMHQRNASINQQDLLASNGDLLSVQYSNTMSLPQIINIPN